MSDQIDTLPFQMNYIPDYIQKKFKEDFKDFLENKEMHMQQLKTLLQGHDLSKDVVFEEDFLNAYLIHCKYDEKKAFVKLQNYLNFRINHSYAYRNVKFDLASHPSCKFVTFLPRRLSDGSVMVLLEPGYWDPDELPFETAKKILYMVFQQELRNPLTQASGFHVIHDVSGAGIKHCRYCTPYTAYLLNQATFAVLPGNFFGLHLINSNFVVRLLVNLALPFMPDYFKKKMYIHSSTDILLEFFPRSVLPARYGGTLEDYDCGMPNYLRKANEQHGDFPIGGQKNLFS